MRDGHANSGDKRGHLSFINTTGALVCIIYMQAPTRSQEILP